MQWCGFPRGPEVQESFPHPRIFTLIPRLLSDNTGQGIVQGRMALIPTLFLPLNYSDYCIWLGHDLCHSIIDCTVACPILKVINSKLPRGYIISEDPNGHSRSYLRKFLIGEEMLNAMFRTSLMLEEINVLPMKHVNHHPLKNT
jgi:hypothetical protein